MAQWEIDQNDPYVSRRAALGRVACGFGSLALAGLCAQAEGGPRLDPLAPKAPHFAPRAKRVIFLFMQGGPSQVESFDWKPDLERADGRHIDFVGVRFKSFGQRSKRKLMRPLWSFERYGTCGQPVSSLFPHIAQHVDDLCMLHGMHTEGVAHGPSTLFLHTGATNLVRPSMGSWISYGLGTENENLPAFVTIGAAESKGGPRNYGNAFLPTVHQGTTVGNASRPATDDAIRHLKNERLSTRSQARQFEFLRVLNAAQLQQTRKDDRLEGIIESFERAYRMQTHAPEIVDLSRERASTLQLYGIGDKATDDFGRRCLMARRLAEAGVRYIQVNYSDEKSTPRWDQHRNMPEHAVHARATDKPVAGLLTDLKQRGLLEDTLLWWGGEFGRTPYSQNTDGRDHNPRGFTIWLAGGGVKPGFAYGATDEIGHIAVDGRVHMHDLHATILHLLGLDHQQLTYRHAGRDFRLTDVYGSVAHEIIA